jgi:hypothetical protein
VASTTLLAVGLAAVAAVGVTSDHPPRVLGLAAWLSLCSSTTTRAPRVA